MAETVSTDNQLTIDYKSDIDIDMHKSVNLLDTDYRPDYDGKINFYNSLL